ncbi:MAG: hypothetical protein AB2689_05925 [Candidatus Thiodiazotropha taylori]
MTASLRKPIVEELLKISSDPEASIQKRIARDIFRDEFDSLCGCGALVHFKNLMDISVVDDDSEFTVEIVRRDGKYMYFSPSDGWVGVLEEDIALYKINFGWLIRQVMNALEIPDRCEAKEILEDYIWVLGRHRIEKQNIPIAITRNTIDPVVFDALKDYLNNHHKSRDPALVLALDRHLPAHLSLPGQNVLVRFEEAMVIESPDFKINTRMLAGKMGGSVDQDGFGSGYRNLVWNGTKYDFTKKQAEAVEYMHNAGGPRHQDEILAEINSSQDKLLQVFRSRGKRHPAWGEVIKNDGKGNYWLEL